MRSLDNEECEKCGVWKIPRVENTECTGRRGWLHCFPVLIRERPIAASVTSHSRALRIAYSGTKKVRKQFSQRVAPWADVKIKVSETLKMTYTWLNVNWQRDRKESNLISWTIKLLLLLLLVIMTHQNLSLRMCWKPFWATLNGENFSEKRVWWNTWSAECRICGV